MIIGDGWDWFINFEFYGIGCLSFNRIPVDDEGVDKVLLKLYLDYMFGNSIIDPGAYPIFNMPYGTVRPSLLIQQLFMGSDFNPDLNSLESGLQVTIDADSIRDGWNEFDITEIIKDDLLRERDIHQLRFKFQITQDHDNLSDLLNFVLNGDQTGYSPYLIYTYENSNHSNENIIERDLINLSNYPNPFNPRTTINFSIPKTDLVNIEIYNVKGQKVKGLLSEVKQKGEYAIDWNGEDSQGISCSSGIYFCRIETSSAKKMHKMILMK